MITLETAILLKESGFSATKSQLAKFTDGSYGAYNGGTYDELYPCPSLEELLAELPREIMIQEPSPHFAPLILDRKTIEWRCGYVSKRPHYITNEPIDMFIYMGRHPDPAEACALLWLKLRKEGLL